MKSLFRRICSSHPGDGEQRRQSLAALTACDWGLYCFQPQRMAACLTCRPDVVCPNRLVGMMQPAKAVHGAFFARRKLVPPGPRARRAHFPTCGVIRVAGIHFSRSSEGRFESPHYPSRKNDQVNNRISKFFENFLLQLISQRFQKPLHPVNNCSRIHTNPLCVFPHGNSVKKHSANHLLICRIQISQDRF